METVMPSLTFRSFYGKGASTGPAVVMTDDITVEHAAFSSSFCSDPFLYVPLPAEEMDMAV